MTVPCAIETFDVSRVYKIKPKRGDPASGLVKALDGVSLRVEEGELFGLLGPNGAGKTTLIKILVTLLLPSGGRALVDGLDVTTQAGQVRRRISMVSGGETSGYGLLTVREQLWMFSQFYGLPGKEARGRIDELLEIMGLAGDADKKVYNLSTGMRQKMNICRGLVSDPKILFLDEPTLGLDVAVARDVRAYVKRWVAERPERTILLTTHYMMEADELCDRVAIVDHGQVVACDTPEGLKRRVQEGVIYRLRVASVEGVGHLAELPAVSGVQQTPHDGYLEVDVALADESALADVIALVGRGGGRLLSLETHKPTLEDTFIALVGRKLSEDTDKRE
ncbi:MAG: ATP-binding cassette domain-containing protein [Dehalococcoidales bacterium]|nr:ATP-binding cassette domain-containing protein [Dehalococcoidales bacterium]